MALISRGPAKRSITTAAVGLLALGFVASCGGNTSSPVTSNTSSSVTAVAAPTTTPPASGEVRLGCGTFCQSAGQYGAAGAPPPPNYAVTIVSTGTVTADADGYVPVTLTCDLSVQCSGALLVSLDSPAAVAALGIAMNDRDGRSDLLLDGGATQTFGVQLPAPALAWLRSNSPTSLGVTADTRPMGNMISAGAELTVAAQG
jgi:hypothetical protein